MSKYGSGLTMQQICRLEVEECKEILKEYNVPASAVEAITDMIEEGWYQAHQACASGRVTERMLQEASVDMVEKFPRYMELKMEEDAKFPWEMDEEEDD